MKDVVAHVRSNVQGKTYESDHELRKSMTDVGCYVHTERIKVYGRLQHIIMNAPAKQRMEQGGFETDAERNSALRDMVVAINSIIEGDM